MRRFLCLLTLCLGLGVSVIYAQEICANGIDDDLDGFIDCFDNECAKNSICTGGYVGNDLKCEAKPSEFPKFSLQLESASPNGTAVHLGRVVVGDIDRDGIPEMITANTFSKKIFILNGENTNGVNTIQKQLSVAYQPAYEDILIANLDNDNCGEIFVLGKDWKIYAYDCQLALLWTSAKLPGDPGMMGLADFNGDGKVELYARNAILNAHTGAYIVAPTASWANVNGGPVAVDILNDATKTAHLPADAVKDDNLELVCGGTIYSVNISAATIKAEMTLPNYARKKEHDATSIADYNNDGSLDVIASGAWTGTAPADKSTKAGNTTVFFWDVKNNILKTYSDAFSTSVNIKACGTTTTCSCYSSGWQNGTGRINIADIDGDGKLNAVYVSGKFLYALNENFKPLWPKITVFEETSGNTGCTLFDFNGDGQSEIVYRDENYIYIINGKDGSIDPNAQQTCVSRTNREYPVVADVDGDGNTELCVTCRTQDFIAGPATQPGYANANDQDFCYDLATSQNSHVRVFRSGSQPWVPARRVWNQHGYFNVNVNDNLTIPKVQQKHHLVFSSNVCSDGPNRPLNSFLNQSPFLNSLGCPKYASPDLAYVDKSLSIDTPTCPDGDFTITFAVTNLGDLTLSGEVPITFYNGNPTLKDAIKLNTIKINLNSFKVGDVQTITNATVKGPGGAFTLYIVLNDGGTTVPTPIKLPNTNFVECNYDNNILSAPVTPLPVTLTALKVQDNIKCMPDETADNGAVRAFIQQVVLQDTIENETDFEFYWSAGDVAKSVADFTGATWTERTAGKYTVYAIHKAAGCTSDTAKVTVDLINRNVNADILQVHPYDACTPPNGALRVVMNDTDANGIGEDPDLFSYTWYEGNDIFTSPLVGINDTVTGLGPISYTVLVKDKATSCKTIESFAIADMTVIPVVTATAVDVTCLDPASGSVSASVNGSTTGYTFKWYNGMAVKATADFVGDLYPNRTIGKYTVVATANNSQCSSSPVEVEVAQIMAPVVSATVISHQTSCDVLQPTGSASANVSGTTTGIISNGSKAKILWPQTA